MCVWVCERGREGGRECEGRGGRGREGEGISTLGVVY